MIPSSITQLAESADLHIKETTPLSVAMGDIQANPCHFFRKSMLSIAFHYSRMPVRAISELISAFNFGRDRALSRWRRLRYGNSGVGLARPPKQSRAIPTARIAAPPPGPAPRFSGGVPAPIQAPARNLSGFGAEGLCTASPTGTSPRSLQQRAPHWAHRPTPARAAPSVTHPDQAPSTAPR